MRSWPLYAIPYLAMLVGLHWLGSAWFSFLIYHGLVLLLVGSRSDLRRSLLAGGDAKVGAAAIIFGLGGGALLLFLAPYAGLDGALINPALAKLGLGGTSWLLFVIYHTLANPWFEELLWRGRLGSDAVGPTWGDVLFAGYHGLVLMLFLAWYWVGLGLVILVVAGWFWRQLRRRHQGLLLPVLSHLFADGSIMIVVCYLSLK